MLWNESYEFGEPELDEEHRKLFAAILRLSDLVEQGKDDIIKTAEDLIYYATEHVEREERFMRTWAYPDREVHMAAHRVLQDELVESLPRILRGGLSAQDFARLALERFADHVNTFDRAFAHWKKTGTRAFLF